MKLFHVLTLVSSIALAPFSALPAAAQTEGGDNPSLTKKLNAYVGCINRLSERSHQSRERYFSWASKKGPTGKERIIYGTYTIYDTRDCRKNVEMANALDPRDAELEAAATAYSEAVATLEPLLKEADDYYTQEDYRDDKMAKGKALHPRLVAAWDAFAKADTSLRNGVDSIRDKLALQRLAEIEQKEGRKARYHIEALMIEAKAVLRAVNQPKPDLAALTKAVASYEAIVKATEEVNGDAPDTKIGSMFISDAKSLLTTSKQLMRRIRDKVPYSTGDKMILNSGGGGWMVEGSPPRLLRDYNQLINAYNRGARI